MYLLSLFFAVVMSFLPNAVYAAYGAVPSSRVDASILRVDEKTYLGVPLEKSIPLVDSTGKEFTLGDMMGKPLILVFSYFSCDGACTAINKTLKSTLNDVERWTLGKDYNVLTLSFDPNDTTQTLANFLKHSDFDEGLPQGWQMATFKNPGDIERLTASVGYKYFWEPRDRVFLHPGLYIVVSPEGRVNRYLYVASIKSDDISISIAKAYGGELLESNVVDFLIGACYSYNYEEGKYSLNYQVFIALGALGLGITSLLGGSIVMKRREQS